MMVLLTNSKNSKLKPKPMTQLLPNMVSYRAEFNVPAAHHQKNVMNTVTSQNNAKSLPKTIPIPTNTKEIVQRLVPTTSPQQKNP
jgi:hypothetical protein